MNPQSAMVGMQGGAVGAPRNSSDQSSHEMLNTYIYDHLCKMKLWDLARSFQQSCPIKIDKTKREMNGDDMDTDSKDGVPRPEDLPIPNIGQHYSDNSFLYDWWSQFWDVYGTARGKGNAMNQQYYNHNMTQAKMRNLSQAQMMGGMNANMMNRPQQFPGMPQANGINNMQKQAIVNRNGMQMMGKMQQNNMQDGDRPQSPGSMGNAPSPSKRPRLDDGQQFNGQPPQAGRGGPMQGQPVPNMPGAPNGMMMQNGMPADMNQLNFAQNGGQKMEMAGVAPQGMEGSFDMMSQQRPMANGAGAANSSQGNHALQDYQMQLMLLEQQNKKRLLMARQEQDNINHVPGSSQPGQIQFAGGQGPQGMSPQNGRPGPSPNPNEQMKRMQTPKMGPGAMPGSPAMAGGDNRGSPMPGMMDQGQMPPNVRQQMFAQQNMMPGQAPSSHPQAMQMQMQFPGGMQPNGAMNMEQMQRMAAQQGRLPNGQPFPQGGQPMMQNPSQGAQMGTPQQRPNNMPPPPAPNNEQRTQPSSPAQGANGPPTPSQQPKAAPKGKKADAKKNPPQKGAAAKKDAATPAATTDAATPTPATPITPMHPTSFSNNKAAPNNATAPAAAPQPPPQQQAPPVMDFGGLGGDGVDGGFDLSFTQDGPDVLENFDFDSFLHNTDDAGGFGNFDFMNLGGMEETAGT